MALDAGRCADSRNDSTALGMLGVAPLTHFSGSGVILSSGGRMSVSPLVEEGLERQSSEVLSCLTYVLFKERSEDLRDRGRLGGQEAF